MADFGNLKGKKGRMGESFVPSKNNNLDAPETAPAEPEKGFRPPKTGRIHPLNFRVTEDFLKQYKRTALDNNLKLVELLEEALEAYRKQQQ